METILPAPSAANRKASARDEGPLADASNGVRLHVLSLGAGILTTTLALMASHGQVAPMPDCAVFADTGWELHAVYTHLAWLRSANVLPFPVHVVSGGDLRADLLRASGGQRWASIPAFTQTMRRHRVSIGMIRRQCTSNYKITPIRRHVRALAGLTRRRSPGHAVVQQWIGISLDEVIRMKPSFEPRQVNRRPLIERRMTQRDCLRWFERHDYPTPPKSSCIGCPFHSDAMWRALRDEDPNAWADAVNVDRASRTGVRGLRAEAFLHRSAVPLDRADLSTAADRGQQDLFSNECSGLCGI